MLDTYEAARRVRRLELMLEVGWCEELERDLERARKALAEAELQEAFEEYDTLMVERGYGWG